MRYRYRLKCNPFVVFDTEDKNNLIDWSSEQIEQEEEFLPISGDHNTGCILRWIAGREACSCTESNTVGELRPVVREKEVPATGAASLRIDKKGEVWSFDSEGRPLCLYGPSSRKGRQ